MTNLLLKVLWDRIIWECGTPTASCAWSIEEWF